MKRVFLALAGTAFALGAAAAETNELEAVDVEKTDDGGLSVEVSMDVLSDYVWRGTICNGNPVWQPSVTVGYDAGDLGTVSANVWSSYDLTHKRGTATNSRRACGLQEFDYTVSYANSLGPVGTTSSRSTRSPLRPRPKSDSATTPTRIRKAARS